MEEKILIDSREGTQVSMKILGTGFKSIDIICITHGHGRSYCWPSRSSSYNWK